jgi:hypothetical protein
MNKNLKMTYKMDTVGQAKPLSQRPESNCDARFT